ncbi:MAG TPA: VOC family protein [Acidimicrobiales bacterium]|nr:VOC family protein [Acidimicrobiales bacterium]
MSEQSETIPMAQDDPDVDASLPTIRWRGINHLALVTPDMDATVRFYHGVLGMRLVASVKAGPMRHYFFEMGEGNTVAFFEWTGTGTFAKPAGIRTKTPLQFDHLSFNVADEQALLDLRGRLKAKGCEVTDVVDHGFIHSIYFTDPAGIALEASCWVLDATARDADYDDARLFADPEPVPAILELARDGRLDHEPTTTLVNGPLDII